MTGPRSVTCSKIGASCGATPEVWSSEWQAKARAAFIQKSLSTCQRWEPSLTTSAGPCCCTYQGK